MSKDVEIYTKPGCPYCKAAKDDMADKGVNFIEYDITSDLAFKEKAVMLAGEASVPVIINNGEVTIGFGGK